MSTTTNTEATDPTGTKLNPHYQAILAHYSDRRAERSGVLLLNHIAEGVAVLRHIGAGQMAIDAFCIHPLVQSDEDLRASLQPDSIFARCQPDVRVVALAMEYRRVANNHLSHHCETGGEYIALSFRHEVNDMLIADKVQNRKDFEIFHKATHPESKRLDMYFKNWLRRLEISEAKYEELCGVMNEVAK